MFVICDESCLIIVFLLQNNNINSISYYFEDCFLSTFQMSIVDEKKTIKSTLNSAEPLIKDPFNSQFCDIVIFLSTLISWPHSLFASYM